MRTRVFSIFIVMLFALSVLGCQSIPQQHRGAATGAGIGAATGAAAGALLGSEGAKTGSAVIGGLVGALVGGAIGHYTQDVKRDRQTTARQYNYRPASGSVLRYRGCFRNPGSSATGRCGQPEHHLCSAHAESRRHGERDRGEENQTQRSGYRKSAGNGEAQRQHLYFIGTVDVAAECRQRDLNGRHDRSERRDERLEGNNVQRSIKNGKGGRPSPAPAHSSSL